MDLFESLDGKLKNLLPYGGCVNYFGPVVSQDEADLYYQKLLKEIDWRHDEAVYFGKKTVTQRKIGWYGDREFGYTYSGTRKVALPWTTTLLSLKQLTENLVGDSFNACLLNLYHDGGEAMSWHSDSEAELKPNGAIASLSFGAARTFSFKHNQSNLTLSQVLAHGSLLVMKHETQSFWQHKLPPSKRVDSPRINLTFRTIVDEG